MASEALPTAPEAFAPVFKDSEEDDSWKCGDKFKYPLPKVDGDPWELLLEPQLKKEKERCEVWKDEVANLLIFAGLFSAVVTAFIIESYKGLQPDPNDTVIALLSRIATNLENNGNSSSTTIISSQLSSQTASSGISRVNILWFISLVLSLTVVLVGTVSLQWLREYLRYPAELSTRDKFAIFNMRREGFQSWYVPQVFVTLPILLQLSLILFLVGLVDFLLLVAPPVVYGPVITVVSFPILFLSLTTVLPSYMWIFPPTIHAGVFGRVSSQCPYQSPQAYVCQSILKPFVLAATPKWIRPNNWSDKSALHCRDWCSVLLYNKNTGHDVLSSQHGSFPYSSIYTHFSMPVSYDLLAGLSFLITDPYIPTVLSEHPTLSTQLSLRCHCIKSVIDASAIFPFFLGTTQEWYKYINFLFVKCLWSRDHYISVDTTTERLQIEDRICSFEETYYRLLSEAMFLRGPESKEYCKLACELFIRIANRHIQSGPLRMQSLGPGHMSLSVNLNLLIIADSDAQLDISRQYTKTLSRLFDAAAGTTTTVGILDDMGIKSINDRYGYVFAFIDAARKIQTAADISLTLRHVQNEVDRRMKPAKQPLDVSQNLLLFFFLAEYTGITAIGQYRYNPDIASAIEINSAVNITEAMALVQSLSKWRDSLKIAPEPIIGIEPPEEWSGYIRLWSRWKHTNPNNLPPIPTSQLSLPSSPPVSTFSPEDDGDQEYNGSGIPLRSLPTEISNV